MEECKRVLNELDTHNCRARYVCNLPPIRLITKPWITQIFVEEMDTLSCAQGYEENHEIVCVLNMANEQWMGLKLVKHGVWTQEEHLLMRTGLSKTMRQKCYPLPLLGGCLHSNIPVFADEQFHILPQQKQFTVDIVTMAAERHPKLASPTRLCIASENLMFHKLIAMLRIAARYSFSSTLVLGAWGCGAFGHPAQHVAKLFKRALNMPEFKNHWRFVVFAIKDAPGQHTGAYLMFYDEFVNRK